MPQGVYRHSRHAVPACLLVEYLDLCLASMLKYLSLSLQLVDAKVRKYQSRFSTTAYKHIPEGGAAWSFPGGVGGADVALVLGIGVRELVGAVATKCLNI